MFFQGGPSERASPFGELVGAAKEIGDAGDRFVVVHRDDVVGVFPDGFEGIAVRRLAGDAFGNAGGAGLLDESTLTKRQLIGRGVLGDDADEGSFDSERRACRGEPTKARAESNGDKDGIEIGDGVEELEPVGGDAADEPGMEGRHGVESLAVG